ncbi:MAG TPA: ATP-binding protein [Thermoanaerobaculia bacterium]|nr:ATP-binding protein [Thermoanaerobaculia bacterium]
MSISIPGPIVLWLSSRYENLELAQAVLEHVCRVRGIGTDAEHWMGVALREALANAIKHGNRQDPAKRVYLSLGGGADAIEILVGDEGEGFEASAVADPLAPENQMKTSGRGIFYMKTFMDEVTFARGENGGTLLSMKKNLDTSTQKGVNTP